MTTLYTKSPNFDFKLSSSQILRITYNFLKERFKNQIKNRRKEKGNRPELELREAANKGAELIGAASGEGGTISEFLDLGVHLRREKGDEEVKNVNSQTIRHDVEALNEVNSDSVSKGDDEEGDPTVEHVGGRFVQKMLEPLRYHEAPP